MTAAQELAQQVRDQIMFHPETHNQSVWFQRMECGTTACVAGWACMLAGDEVNAEDITGLSVYTVSPNFTWRQFDGVKTIQSIPSRAQDLLGLNGYIQEWLFHENRSREEVIQALDYLAKGDQESRDKLNQMVTDYYDQMMMEEWDDPDDRL